MASGVEVPFICPPPQAGVNFKDQSLVPCTPRRKFGPQRGAEMFTHMCI